MAEITLKELEELVRLKDRTQLWWNLRQRPEDPPGRFRTVRMTIVADDPPRLRVEEMYNGAERLRDVVVDLESLFTLVPLLVRALGAIAVLEGAQEKTP